MKLTPTSLRMFSLGTALAALVLGGCSGSGMFARALAGHGGEMAPLDADVAEVILDPKAAGSDGAASKKGAAPKTTAPAKAERRWVRHTVVPRERLDDVAARYGVSKAEIIRWNKRLQKKAWIYAGQSLKLHARKFPPARRKVTYTVRRGDTWQKIANKNRIRVSDLKAWNKTVPRAFRAGTKLVVWTNPRPVKPTGSGASGAKTAAGGPVEFDVRPGGLSVGRPNRGRIQHGVQLPKSDLYTLRDPDQSWGSSHAVGVVQSAIARFRIDSGYSGEIVIADMSKKGGGRLRPHRSHQSGRDIDIRLPRRRGASKKSHSPSDMDWDLSWALVKGFVESGEVQYIFLDYNRQKLLSKAAKRAGATKAEIAKAIQYPRSSRSNNGVVRHAKGHTSHIHVRMTCAKSNSRCESY